jgi:hypothetical protein
MTLPIANIEAQVAANASKQGLMTGKGKSGQMIPNTTVPDLTLYQYFSLREYEKIVQAVWSELTSRLLKLAESNAPQPSFQAASQEAKLKLMIFEEGRNRALQEEIHHTQPENGYPHIFVFGLALVNETETVVPHGVYITISFFWDGVGPELSPSFGFSPTPNHEGWAVEDRKIINEYPAVLTFEGPDLNIPFRQPKKWNTFLATVPERMRGRFILDYTITSIQPTGRYTGNLFIVLD